MNASFAIQTYKGEAFDPKNGKITDISIDDISHALSNLCRYAGHCRKFYSVAEHSVLVSRIIKELWPKDLDSQWAGLLHDATEAYVGDVPTPIKVLLPKYELMEDQLADKIAKRFKISKSKTVQTRVKTADIVALATEAERLFDDVSHWSAIKGCRSMPHLQSKRFPVNPATAQRMFMREFRKLERLRKKK